MKDRALRWQCAVNSSRKVPCSDVQTRKTKALALFSTRLLTAVAREPEGLVLALAPPVPERTREEKVR